MTNWTEVNVYTGRPVDEDAPTNFAGAGSGVDMNPTGMRKKKKKLVDARTKSYKSHRAKLETARVKREAKRNSVKEEVELDEALSPQDKKVVDTFYKNAGYDYQMVGKILKVSDNGNTLEKTGIGAQTIAKVIPKSGGKFKIVAKMDGKSTQEIVRYIKKSFPKDVLESVEEETLDEAMDKKTAIEILKIKKKEDFFGRDGAKIYMSPDERDALKKKVGRLGRDVPGPSKGVSTMIIINNALGKDGTDGNRGDYDTEGKKMISYKKGGKSIGTPRTIGDAMKLAGIREEVERKTFSQKVKESISEFGVESLLAEDNVDVLRSIVKRKSAKPIKFKDGTMTIDMQTANMMLTVLDKVKPDNQRKLAKMMNGKKSEFMKVHGFVMKALGK
jgi:hypothetical protein